jgi:hypothetical protein
MQSNNDLNTQMVAALAALKAGDFNVRLSTDQAGMTPELVETFNGLVSQISALASEMNRLFVELANEGRLGGQAEVADLSGGWMELRDNLNEVEGALTGRIRATSTVAQLILQNGKVTPYSQMPKNEIMYLDMLVHGLARKCSEQSEPVA